MNEVISNLASNVWRLSTDELKQARQIIDAQLGILRQKNENYIKQQLRPGMKCKVNHAKALGKVFIITKVNKTRVRAAIEGSPALNSITGGSYGNFSIPISLLEIIG